MMTKFSKIAFTGRNTARRHQDNNSHYFLQNLLRVLFKCNEVPDKSPNKTKKPTEENCIAVAKFVVYVTTLPIRYTYFKVVLFL